MFTVGTKKETGSSNISATAPLFHNYTPVWTMVSLQLSRMHAGQPWPLET